EDEQGECDDSDQYWTKAAKIAKTRFSGTDQAVCQRTEADDDQKHAYHIKPPPQLLPALRNMPERDGERDRRERQIDQEGRMPRQRVDQPSAERRREGRRHAGEG